MEIFPVDEDGNPIYIKTGETKTVKDGEYSESTITCYPEDGGASFPVTGVNPSVLSALVKQRLLPLSKRLVMSLTVMGLILRLLQT